MKLFTCLSILFFCPFLIIVIGFPISPISLQGLPLFKRVLSTIDPNLIDWPNLPSIKVSPSYGCKEYIFSISLKYSPGDLGSKFSSKISG